MSEVARCRSADLEVGDRVRRVVRSGVTGPMAGTVVRMRAKRLNTGGSRWLVAVQWDSGHVSRHVNLTVTKDHPRSHI